MIPKFVHSVSILSSSRKRESSAKRIFLLGSNISKSVSPAFQNRAFEKTGFSASYELLEIPRGKFDTVMKRIQREDDILGFNITAPYKEQVLPYISKLDPQSRAIGAVNTVKISRNGKMTGYNTDVDGIAASLSKLHALGKKEKCVILGAGGAARACAYTALKSGFGAIVILNRSIDRAKRVRTHFMKLFPRARVIVGPLDATELTAQIRDANLLINAVTNPFPFKVDFSDSPKDLKFMDLGYKEPSSVLIQARDGKRRSIDGLLMLVEQGAKSFEIWTGLEAPRRAMLLAAKRQLLNVS